MLEQALPCIKRNGSAEHALPNNLNVSIEGIDGAAFFGRLKQVAVSNASSCLNGTQDYSQVLTLLGVERDLARATLRFGLGRFTTREEILKAAEEIILVVNDLRRMEKEFAAQTGTVYRNGGCTS
jgi:cysteine desulfurase